MVRLSTSTPLTSAEAPTPAQRAVIEHLRRLTAGDLEAWADLFAPEGLLTFPFAPAGMPAEVQGRAGLLAHMRNFPRTFDVEAVGLAFVRTDDPLVAVAEFKLTGRAIPTGKPYEQRCVSIVRTDAQGRIVRYDDYWNPLTALEALSPAREEGLDHAGVARSFGSGAAHG